MVSITYLRPGEAAPKERHVVVVIHRDGIGADKGYFYDSDKGDPSGSGPFDWLMEEAIERAERFARDIKLDRIVVRAKPTR